MNKKKTKEIPPPPSSSNSYMRTRTWKDENGIPVEEAIVELKVIGYTRTGKEIFLDSHFILHGLFDYEDHVDAEALHKVMRNEAFLEQLEEIEREHSHHAHNHRRFSLIGIERDFETACLNHIKFLYKRMGELKAGLDPLFVSKEVKEKRKNSISSP